MTLRALTPMLAGIALVATVAMGCASTHREAASSGAASSGAAPSAAPSFDPSEQVEPATTVLRGYEAALNKGDVDAIVALYAPDAVFMAQHRSAAIGHTQIETAYREIFGMIKLDIKFEIDEVVVVSPTVAYARTRSAGKTTIVANDVQVSEGNQELFVLVRQDDNSNWKIGRYIFSTTQPRS